VLVERQVRLCRKQAFFSAQETTQNWLSRSVGIFDSGSNAPFWRYPLQFVIALLNFGFEGFFSQIKYTFAAQICQLSHFYWAMAILSLF
jgi:hypothetical protein